MGWRVLLPAYYTALVLGVLPAGREGPLFLPSGRALLCCAAHAVFFAYVAVDSALKVVSGLSPGGGGSCNLDNSCLTVAVYSAQLASEAAAVGGALLARRRTLRCLNGAAALLQEPPVEAEGEAGTEGPLPLPTLLQLVPVACAAARVPLLLWLRRASPASTALLAAAVLPAAAVETLAAALCLALQRALKALNAELTALRHRPSAARELHLLRRRHGRVCDLATDVRRRFGPDLLVLVPVCFVQVVLLLFFAVVSFSPSSPPFPPWYFASAGSHILVIVLRLLHLCYRCDAVVSEADRTGVAVQRLNNWNLDEGTKEEIRFFTLQLNTRRISFNACGFFFIDFTLLYSMVGAMTTYLVILVQFDPEVQISANVSSSAISGKGIKGSKGGFRAAAPPAE